jgi:hypothetical protein
MGYAARWDFMGMHGDGRCVWHMMNGTVWNMGDEEEMDARRLPSDMRFVRKEKRDKRAGNRE